MGNSQIDCGGSAATNTKQLGFYETSSEGCVDKNIKRVNHATALVLSVVGGVW